MNPSSYPGGSETNHGFPQEFPGAQPLRRVLEAVGSVSWPALAFEAGDGGPVLATRMLASILVHAYWRGYLSSEEIEEACRTEDDFRYLCSGDAPEARVFRRFRRSNASALVESLSILMTPSGTPEEARAVMRDRARRCLESAIAADSLALDL